MVWAARSGSWYRERMRVRCNTEFKRTGRTASSCSPVRGCGIACASLLTKLVLPRTNSCTWSSYGGTPAGATPMSVASLARPAPTSLR